MYLSTMSSVLTTIRKQAALALAMICFGSAMSFAQGNPTTSASLVIKNGASQTVTFAVPSTGLSSYTLTYPSALGASGSILFANSGTGNLNWLTPGAANSILSIAGGVPTWVDPVTLLSSLLGTSYVQYNVSAPQSGSLLRSNYLFNVAYGSLALGTAANGGLINSAAGVVGNNAATGLTIFATANGTGTATGLAVTASGSGTRTAVAATGDVNLLSTGGAASSLSLQNPAGTYSTKLTAGTQTANINYTLPTTAPTSGQVLSSNSSGVMSWVNSTSGSVTSVGLTVPSGLSVSPSTITSAGTFAITTALNGIIHGNGSGFTAGNVNLATEVSGIVSTTNGGLGINTSSAPTGSLLYTTGVGTWSTLPAGSNGQILTLSGGNPTWANSTNGTVTSVGLTMPSGLSVSGSPITSSGTLAVTTTLNGIIHGNGSGFTAGNVNLATEVSGLVSTANGGLGINTSTTPTGSVLYTTASGTWSTLPAGSNGQVLTLSGGNPSWSNPAAAGVTSVALTVPSGLSVSGSPITSSGTLAITTSLNGLLRGNGSGFSTGNVNLASEVTGILNTANGGLGINTSAVTAGKMLYTSGTGTWNTTAAGTNGQILSLSGGVPTWTTDLSNGTVTSVALTMPSGLTVTGSPITSSGTFAVTTALNGVIHGNGSGFTAGNVNLATEVSGLLSTTNGGLGINTSAVAAGRLLYTSGTGTWSTLNPGTTGQVLTISGGNPVWSNSSSGTVTSVGLTVPSGLSVSGSPITSSGTLAITTSLNGIIRGNGSGFTAGNVNLSSEVTGLLSPSNGGLGINTSSTPAGSIVYTTGAGSWSTLSAGSTGQVLTISGGAPTWSSPSSSNGWSITGNNGLTDGTNNFLGTLDSKPIRFITNGTSNERMRITQGGYVGIGTPNPSTVLQIVTQENVDDNDVILSSFNSTSDYGGEFITTRARGNLSSPSNVNVGDDLGGLKFRGYRNGNYVETDQVNIVVDGTSPGLTASMAFNTSDGSNMDTRLYIAGKGNVGIANTNPQTTLDVDGGFSMRSNTYTISGNTTVYPDNRSYIKLSHSSSTSTFTVALGDGQQDGQVLVVQTYGSQTSKCKFHISDGNNLRLSSDFDPTTLHSTLSLIWDSNEQAWIETGRSMN